MDEYIKALDDLEEAHIKVSDEIVAMAQGLRDMLQELNLPTYGLDVCKPSTYRKTLLEVCKLNRGVLDSLNAFASALLDCYADIQRRTDNVEKLREELDGQSRTQPPDG